MPREPRQIDVTQAAQKQNTIDIARLEQLIASTTTTGSGGGDKNYVHDQGIPSLVWTVNHYLGKKASVSVVDSAGSAVVGIVHYTCLDSLTITFNSSFSGEAYIN